MSCFTVLLFSTLMLAPGAVARCTAGDDECPNMDQSTLLQSRVALNKETNLELESPKVMKSLPASLQTPAAKKQAILEAVQIFNGVHKVQTQGQHSEYSAGGNPVISGITRSFQAELQALVSEDQATIIREGSESIQGLVNASANDWAIEVNKSTNAVVDMIQTERDDLLDSAATMVQSLGGEAFDHMNALALESVKHLQKYAKDIHDRLIEEFNTALEQAAKCFPRNATTCAQSALKQSGCQWHPKAPVFKCRLSDGYKASSTQEIKKVLQEGQAFVTDLQQMANTSIQTLQGYVRGNVSQLTQQRDESAADLAKMVKKQSGQLSIKVSDTINRIVADIKRIIEKTVVDMMAETSQVATGLQQIINTETQTVQAEAKEALTEVNEEFEQAENDQDNDLAK